MRLNIRLMGVLFGIVCIGADRAHDPARRRAAARARATATTARGARSSSVGAGADRDRLRRRVLRPLIKAAVSRQREFLADASAVQFTRNPHGIAGALKKIGGSARARSIGASHAEEASHLFFGDIQRHRCSSRACSPRIRRSPSASRASSRALQASFRRWAKASPSPTTCRCAGSPAARSPPPRAMRAPAAIAARVGMPDDAAQQQALRTDPRRSARSCASWYAVRSRRAPRCSRCCCRMSGRAGAPARADRGARVAAAASEALRVLPALGPLGKRQRLSLCELLAPALRELSQQQRAVFTRTVQALIDADDAISIFELRDRRDAARAALGRAQRRRARERAPQGTQVVADRAAGAALAAGACGCGRRRRRGAGVRRRARRACRSSTPRSLPYGERLIAALPSALGELRACSPQLCARIVDACAHAVLADRRVTEDEATLLSATCSALGCPLPPFAEATTG